MGRRTLDDTPLPPDGTGDARVVIRPRPGGRAPLAAPPAAPAEPAAEPAPSAEAPRLLPAAAPLLQLLARLRAMAAQPDPAALRARTDAALAAFERRTAEAGVPEDQVRRAHYALCAALDAAVLNTPWGNAGAWAERPLLAAHHPAVGAGRVLDVLAQAERKGAPSLPLVELMHACLCLGIENPVEAEARAAAYAFIQRHAPPVPPELAPAWRGVDAPYAPRRAVLPVWVAASAGLAAIAGLYLWVSNRADDASDAVFAGLVAAPPAQMPQIAREAPVVPPAPAPDATAPGALDRLRARLRTAAGVSVVGTPDAPVVRIAAGPLFRPGSAALLPGAAPVLEQVAAALGAEGGSVRVIGYTDSQPFRSVQFPSNFQLSAARAQAALDALPGARGSAEGRGAAAPAASNATAEGREQNRRIDILLRPS